MIIRKLNERGIQKFQDFLDEVSGKTSISIPENLLTDSYNSEPIGTNIHIQEIQFQNKFEIARYLYSLFSNQILPELETEQGVWCWLSLYYFGQLCGKTRDKKYNPKDYSNWIPALDDYSRHYRHAIAGPYEIFKTHKDNPSVTFGILSDKPDKLGDIYEQIAARKYFVTNASILELVNILYFHHKTKKKKVGASGKKGGSPRRLAAVLQQLRLTWDLYSMTTEDILDMLPSEFDRFKP